MHLSWNLHVHYVHYHTGQIWPFWAPFFAKSTCQYEFGKILFFSPSYSISKSSKLAIFGSLPHFSRIEGRISKIEGSEGIVMKSLALYMCYDWWPSKRLCCLIKPMKMVRWGYAWVKRSSQAKILVLCSTLNVDNFWLRPPISLSKVIFGNFRSSPGGRNTFFAVHSWQKYRNTGSKFGNTPENPVKRVGVYL